MPELINLEDALEGIMDGIEAAIRAAINPGQPLAGIKTVIRGDRARPAPLPPTIWFRGMSASCDHAQRSHAEKWTFDVLLLAIVKNDDPAEGTREATALAARARTAVLKDRSLGQRRYVQDVRSINFEMSGPNLQNESLFAATATLQVHFIILENNP